MGGYNNLSMLANMRGGFGGSVNPQWAGFGSAPVGGFGGSVTPQPVPGGPIQGPSGGFGGTVNPQPVIGGGMPANGVRPVGPQPVQGGSYPGGGFGGTVHPQPWGGMQGYGGYPGVRPVGPQQGQWGMGGGGYNLQNLMMLHQLAGNGFGGY